VETGACGALFLHYPCFDGLVSAAIAWDYLETSAGWAVDAIRPVNYDVRGSWLETPLPAHSAVVDFLYHPDAAFWADHHGTTFLTDASLRHYEDHRDGRGLLYDRTETSCAKLLWERFRYEVSDPQRYGELARWADKTDSAAYESVDEAIDGSSPALEIARSLALGDEQGYCELLLRHMRVDSLERIAALPDVRSKALEVRRRTELGIGAVGSSIEERDGIAIVDATQTGDAMINRYSPYRFHPEARYSVALIRSERDAKITAMRNPWKDFESVQLGQIFQKFGGGGHQRVGSLVMAIDDEPEKRLASIVDTIREEDQAQTTRQKRATV
jgi:hypothetical protein